MAEENRHRRVQEHSGRHGLNASYNAPVGVFDSGVGGLSVLAALRQELPHEDFVYYADSAFAPYGERDAAYVLARSIAVAQHLRHQYGIKALVIACNTATAAAITPLRAQHADLHIVGVEPALKPAAAASRTGRVGVLATRGTLASARFQALHARLQAQAAFVLQPCDGLADAIESDDAERIHSLASHYLQSLGPLGPGTGCIDTIVLGCTHYPFARDVFQRLADAGTSWLDTGAPVARRLRQLLRSQAAGLRSARGRVVLDASGSVAHLHAFALRRLPSRADSARCFVAS
jgi:glutamate racemase